jgi:uncharacterized protein YukE
VASGGYEVTFDELSNAAAAYGDAAESLKTALENFQAAAKLSRGDFGRLPTSQQMDNEYNEFYDHVVAQMNDLHSGLVTGGLKLAASGSVYRAAEEQNTIRTV